MIYDKHFYIYTKSITIYKKPTAYYVRKMKEIITWSPFFLCSPCILLLKHIHMMVQLNYTILVIPNKNLV